jgi:hypothetical protein
MKFYTDDAKKYGGEVYDILDAKLQVFYDCCITVGVLEEQYYMAFPIILKDRVSDFYYDKITGRSYDFITMVRMVKTHFETEENRQLYMSEWRETTYQRIIDANLEKSRLKCLQILFDKL